jgi:beta-carotene 3-hydroxylase
MHHKHLDKENGESFGMLIVSGKYWQKVKNDQRHKGDKLS